MTGVVVHRREIPVVPGVAVKFSSYGKAMGQSMSGEDTRTQTLTLA